MKTIIILLIACVSMAFSCERSTEEVAPADSSKLVGSWKLVEPASNYQVTLLIDHDKTQTSNFSLTGQSSVNQYFASVPDPNLIFSSTPNSFVIQQVGATKIAGPVEAMQFEQTYFDNLRNVKRYELTNQNRLRLYYEGASSGMLVYEKAK